MLFNSFSFAIFFPLVTIVFFLLPHRFRWLHLLISSCVFYMTFIPVYILILFFTIIVDYIAGIMIESSQGHRRKVFLIISIIVNVGTLAFFKYFNFFADNVNTLLQSLHLTSHAVPFLRIILPIGLSFHTFQAMSYTIEVYRGHQKAERHFGIYSLYVMFYPQLVAGPIERPQNMLHQFHEKQFFKYNDVVSGLRLMMWGLLKKVVIADRLAILTDAIFNHPHDYPGISLAIATFFFTFQIYCDFSGYSDMAIGAARVMGFKLMKNFDRPYSSASISEFWSRWHISLSTWFKDYLYISLGGNRVAMPRWFFNLFIVFLVSGFWHGANWTFIVWGMLHGFYLIAAILIDKAKIRFLGIPENKPKGKVHTLINIAVTFVLVSVAWIFFRANSVSDAFYIIGRLPSAINDVVYILKTHKVDYMGIWDLGKRYDRIPKFLGTCALILLLEASQYIQYRYNFLKLLESKSVYLRWGFYYTLILVIIFFGVFESRQFIYFQF